ncbi:MAG: ABC transporter ATP-binding protein [Planctomycetes bacterium]|uniref:ABC transporter ATP-binding protein n=1 Tax=Candidatus Wunengus californicus TaxID=3367619 RepID=UPI0040255B9B|nr:ABC transporter ATP-binding protein [Planctomycetota bacterium]
MKKDNPSKSTYIRLLGYLKPYWHKSIIILILSALGAYIAVLPTQILGIAVDEIKIADKYLKNTQTDRHDAILPNKTHAHEQKSAIPLSKPLLTVSQYIHTHWFKSYNATIVTLLFLAMSFIFMHAASGGIMLVHGFITSELGQRLIYDLRNQLYGHIQRLPLTYFENNKTGDIMSRLMNDVNSLEQAIVGPIITFITDMLKFGWIIYFCIKLDWQLTCIALIVCPFISLCTYNFGKRIRRVFRSLRDKTGELNSLIQDNISGIKVIAGFAKEAEELGRFQKKNYENYNLYVRILQLASTLRPVVDFITEIGAVVVICLGGYKVLQGQISAGTFVIFFPYLQMMYGPITGLTRFYNQVLRAIVSSERVFEILDTPSDLKDSPNAVDLPPVHGTVEFRHVNFMYNQGIEVLTDINITARTGQMIALVGPSGSGKTTLTKLIPRFYDPTKGDIYIDGYDIKHIKLHSLRKQMAMVLQEPFLFNDTINANIAYARSNASAKEIESAAQAANAHNFIATLPNGYDSVIGERGVKLSGGQKQRIAIARAILANPRILILDEATSSVDTETEQLIQNAIYRLVKDRTTFVIAHRLSTILHADLIVVLDKGRIVETGLHHELLANGGLYKKLFEMQFNTQEKTKPEIVETEIEKAEAAVTQEQIIDLNGPTQHTRWS